METGAAAIVKELTELGVALELSGDNIRYRAPSGRISQELRSRLAEHKQEVIDLLRRRHEGPLSSLPFIGPSTADKSHAPLSFGQERLWFLDRLGFYQHAYNIPIAVRLSGRLNRVALEQALNETLTRHEVLRAAFKEVEGRPVVVTLLHLGFRLPVIEVHGETETAREAEALRLANEDVSRPFDLADGPLFRACLLRLAEDDHMLVITMHHIVSDGLSLHVLLRETALLYEDFSLRGKASLPALPLQYTDYALWQHWWLQGEFIEDQRAYWKRKLAGELPALELFAGQPRPDAPQFRGARHSFTLSEGLSDSLKTLSRREGVTLFVTLLAAFQTLLHRYTQQDDILVGTPVSSRRWSELEGLVGFFVNTLVLRTDLGGNPSFRELLGRVRREVVEAFSHQDIPFEKVVEEIRPERNLDRAPLFQVMFVLHNSPANSVEFSGLKLDLLDVDTGTSKFDLTLSLVNSEQGVTGSLEYNSDLFGAGAITRLVNNFRTLLKGITENPDEHLSSLPLLTDTERQQLLRTWNDNGAFYERGKSFAELFESQALHTPDAVAVAFEDEQLSYGQLNRRANQLSRYLRRLGVGPDVLVGVYMQRSAQMLLGVLGILKAGGAYVPLDPAYPKERLSFMCKDTRLPVLLTHRQLIENLPEHHAAVVCLDRDWHLVESEGHESLQSVVGEDNLLYIIFTSGSTGRPKGVAMVQRVLLNLLTWQMRNSTREAVERTLHFASLSFDVSFQEIFSTWLAGGTLVVVSEEMRRDAAALLRFIEGKAVTRTFLPFVALQQLSEVAGEAQESLTHIREIITAGEQLLVTRHVVGLFEGTNHCVLHNQYGPTETHVVTSYGLEGAPGDWRPLPPIGRPIPNARVYLLDSNLGLVPQEVPGELYIGGICLARGYLNRPGLTAQRFVADPFSVEPGARMYRTGDVARYLPDGDIEFLGRIGNQVKIRGYRVEPGEVEATLSGHSAIRENVVVAREESVGNKQLVAYVVAAPGAGLHVGELREYLRGRLPEYMIPARFVLLDGLPLTPSGKVDRSALPAPTPADAETTSLAPRTLAEEVLAGIWTDLLKVERIGGEDSFFDLGGHSLLATQLMSRVRDTFGVELPLRVLFQHPTLCGLAGEIDEAVRREQGLKIPPIERASRDEEIPLSFAQQRLWFIEQLQPGNQAYNNDAAVRLKGHLDVVALEKAFNEIIRRHEVLRTFFPASDGRPTQVIAAAKTMALGVTDLSHLPEAEREREVYRLAAEEARHSFDLSRGPLLRARLLRQTKDEHVLLIVMHHIISDGWSVGVFVREMALIYKEFLRGNPSPLEELPIQYADYAVWQRSWLRGELLGKQLSYWKAQLKGAPAMLDLPTNRPRPPVQTFRGASYRFSLAAGLTGELKKLSRREGATLFMTLLASFQTLLFRYTHQEDIVVSSGVANRNHSETEQLIGCLINILILRTDMSGNPSFKELLRRVREVTLEASAHQDMPFELLIKELHPERDQSFNPLTQVMLVLLNAPMEVKGLPGLTMEFLAVDREVAQFDITVHFWEEEGRLHGSAKYNTDLFDPATVIRLFEQFERLLVSVTTNPEQHLAELPLLTEAESRLLLAEWNETRQPYPEGACLHQLFEAKAAQSPAAVAVIYDGQTLSYGELNRRANQMARHLESRGLHLEARVGLCLDKSLDMVVGILGILKAGGAYVPLDANYPPERLAFMIEDAQVPLVLSQQHLMGCVPLSGAEVICVDGRWAEVAPESTDEAAINVSPDNLAYVIYTSGSTGRPKGVAIRHRGVVNNLTDLNRQFGVNESDSVMALSSASFDMCVYEVLGTLAAGATVVMPRADAGHDPAYWAELIRRHGVTIWNSAPSMLELLVEQVAQYGAPRPTSLRLALLGGDWIQVTLPDRVRAVAGSMEVISLGGATEASIHSTIYPVGEVDPNWRSIPYGKPMANQLTYVLDDSLQPVPVGVMGELHLGGVALARGYFNRPGLTAEKFIPDPFSREPGCRLYKTGDMARYKPDGNLELIGRIDNQVKIRGFRIELGEIVAALRGHGSIEEAVVVARTDEGGNKYLVGYVVSNEQPPPTTGELREYLRGRLPEYMIPARFVLLDGLPLTPNGKVDRSALPAPEVSRADLTRCFVAPRTGIEEMLCNLWAEVLRAEAIGVEDNFFELGGHSLLATQLMARLGSAFAVELPLRALFEAPTVAGLAQLVEGRLSADGRAQMPPLQAASRTSPAPLSFAQQRLWFLDQLEPDSPVYNIPFAVNLAGRLDSAGMERALSEVVQRHEALRTAFVLVEGRPAQLVSPARPVELSQLDLSGCPPETREAEAQRLIDEMARESFNLAAGPLMRAVLLRLSTDEHILFVSMHHIISDGWSVGVFIREVAALYGAYSKGEPSPLPELPVQYADYAIWQREWLRGELLEGQLTYWREQLANVPALELPTDRPRPAVMSYRGAHHSVRLGRELVAGLKALSCREGTTLFMTMLAAFDVLLWRYSGQTDITTGTPVAGRTQIETEPLIGCFINTLALRVDLSGDPTFSQLLRKVRDTLLQAYAHQTVPFERVVEAVQPERSLSRSPVFQVMFTLQNTPRERLDLPGLKVDARGVGRTTSKFDLTLTLSDDEEGLVADFEYSVDLFDGATVRRMAEHFRRLLESVTRRSEQRVGRMPLLLPAELEQLREWNDTRKSFAEEGLCLHELIEAQVGRRPEAATVIFEGRRLTYGELNERANRLAHHLRGLGVTSESRVGVLLERSAEMLVALLGILKAGAAYVPLDPDYPQERLSFMLEDSQAEVLLTQQPLLERFGWLAHNRARALCLDADWPAISRRGQGNPCARATPDDLAYVIYTSGSTGRPKGVQIPHRAVVNFLAAMQRLFNLSERDVLLSVTSLSFDIAGLELYLPLTVGASVVLVSREVTLDATALREQLHSSGASIMQATPAAWRLLLEANWEGDPRLKMLCGGEVLPRELASQLMKRGGELWNMYGPTETTIWSLCRRIEPGHGRITIGFPIANTQVYVLDEQMLTAPVGVAGELYIGGDGLSRGYLRRPGLTAERFVPDPLGGVAGARLYRTGDLVRLLPDGEVEFLGRIDHQVKVRGHRIEPGEIEAVLMEHADVENAVVTVRQERSGDHRLVAYVVGRRQHAPSVSELRRHAKGKLPEYMVPTAWTMLDALPVTPNGKLDRRTLPEPTPPEPSVASVMPRDTVELRLKQIWEDTLGASSVGVTDNFFELGGHSILAVQLMAGIRERFNQHLPLSVLFYGPTIEQLAVILRKQLTRPFSSPLVEIQPSGARRPFFCVHPVGGNVLCYAELARSLGPEQPFYGLQSPGLYNERDPPAEIVDMAARYVAAVRDVQPRGPYVLGGWSLGGVIAFDMARQLQERGEEVALLALMDSFALAPRLPVEDYEDESIHMLRRFFLDRGFIYGLDLTATQAELSHLGFEEQLNHILDSARQANILPPDAELTEVRHSFRVFKSNLKALRKYTPERYSGRIDLFRCGEPGDIAPLDAKLGWGDLADSVEVHVVPGNHYTMLSKPHVESLSSRLKAALGSDVMTQAPPRQRGQ